MTQTTAQAITVDINPHSASDSGAGDIIPSVPVERIVALRESGVSCFLDGIALIREAQKTLAAAAGRDWFPGMTEILEVSLSRSGSEKENEATRRLICRHADRDIWTRLMQDTGMLTLMSAAQKKQWDKELYSDNCPEITLDNVLATFRQLNASKADTFEQGLIDVFRNLSWDYKTNNPRYLGKRIIIDGVLDNYQGKWYSVRSYGQERINDLARPFWVLDGKTVPDFRVSEGAQLSEFIQRGGGSCVGELLTCDYFT
ncbi:DUF4942 domain-containing protein, partial [Salmonella enterica]|nr:DUF4942 domain-containing protein [Salmonella enterica]